MAQYLAIDWHQDQLHLVLANVGKGRAQIKRAVVFEETLNPESDDTAALGEMLRSRLKEAGIASAPVIACVSRDRVIIKEVTYPPVAAHEEPQLVRMQVQKELTESPDSVVIDYVPLKSTHPIQKRALAFVLKKSFYQRCEQICKAAGLRLNALVPRPFGLAACLQEVAGTTPTVPAPASPDSPVAMVTIGNRWGEFCVLRGEEVLQTRSLTVGPNIAAEIRRNLVVYSAQSRQAPIEAVYLALGSAQPTLLGQLQERLDVPIHTFDPFAGAEGPELPNTSRGSFAGAVGLLHAQAKKQDKPVNFTKPKEPKPPRTEVSPLHLALVALLLVALVLGGLFAHKKMVVAKTEERDELQAAIRNDRIRRDHLKLEHERLRHLDNWDNVVWLDEVYELAAIRSPDITDNFRFREVYGKCTDRVEKPTPGMKKKPVLAGQKFDAELVLKIDTLTEQEAAVYQLRDDFDDAALTVKKGGKNKVLKFYETRSVKPPSNQSRRSRLREYTVTIGVRQRVPGQYEEMHPPPAAPEDMFPPDDFPADLR